MRKAIMHWSSGKDAAMALDLVQEESTIKVEQLFTTISKPYQRVTMHGLRRALVEAQAKALGLPLNVLELAENTDMNTYGKEMSNAMQPFIDKGFKSNVFGDIFLKDLRQYREEQFSALSMQCTFPLWGKNTKKLIQSFIEKGYRAIVVAADADLFPEDFVGSTIDHNWLKNLPKDVDPCGENGEFHTFCYNGPLFKESIPFSIGQRTHRRYTIVDKSKKINHKGFWFVDLELN